jgi:hypothetical protein
MKNAVENWRFAAWSDVIARIFRLACFAGDSAEVS